MSKYLVGLVGTCSKGIKGYITGRKVLSWGPAWVGFSQKDGSPWSSRNPTIVEELPTYVAVNAAKEAAKNEH